MKGQKEAVIEEVLLTLPGFTKYSDNAILTLTEGQLEVIKNNIFNGIINQTIEYGKDPNNHSEARTYARSMVMNHLKKAKELNGGHTYTNSTNTTTSGNTQGITRPVRTKVKIAPKGVNPDLLTEELQEFVKTLV
jgi:hypothetical protein